MKVKIEAVAMMLLGIVLGIAVGYRLFAPAGTDASMPGATKPVSGSTAIPARSGQADAAPTSVQSASGGCVIPSATSAAALPAGTLAVAVETLAKVPVPAFVTPGGDPWLNRDGRFVLTPEVRDILGIDERTAGEIQRDLEQACEEATQAGWESPARIDTTEKGVTLTITSSSPEVGERIAGQLKARLGEERARLFGQYAKQAFDWEFGSFGLLDRVLEVTVLPDNTVSIRESLRPVSTSDEPPANIVERSVRQYRVRQLPTEISRFVEIPVVP